MTREVRQKSARELVRRGYLIVGIAAAALIIALGIVLHGWYGAGPLKTDTTFLVAEGASLDSVADELARAKAIGSARGFRLRARLFGAGASGIKAGEFNLPARASESNILAILRSNAFVRRLVTVPEGMPSVAVYERLNAQPLLTGGIAVPAEGSVLPDTYDYARGEARAALLARMQSAMRQTLATLWARRDKGLVVKTPAQALVLASIVEKETGKPAERAMVAGLYANRLRAGMPLQADPTIIYPITKGKPLGRRIKQSEIAAVNGYNTYTRAGLPQGPITNPSRASLAAVLHPAKTDALYMVADGSGGHAFAATLDQHQKNVAKWFALRKARGEL